MMSKGGRTRRSGTGPRSRSRSHSRSRSRTPEAMRRWINQLAPGVTYRFQTDNEVQQVGQYVGREGNNFIFLVNGRRTNYPMRIIRTMQPRTRLPGFDEAFVRHTGGKTRKRSLRLY